MTPTFKNEIDFLANKSKAEVTAFQSMCNSILNNYTKLSKEKLIYKFNNYSSVQKSQPALLGLFDKLHHMTFSLYSPQSIPGFLTRIVTKPIKVISKPEYKEQPEIYGKGHFRWDWKAYTLNDNELQAIRIYLGLHLTKKQIKVNPTKISATWEQFEQEQGYEEKANLFLHITGTTFTSEFKEHDYYFTDDTESRDIYTCVLKNSAHRYRFTFGQSINNTGQHPTAYDILASITKYEVGTFDDFCSEYGYSGDSRKDYKTYKAVLREWKNVELLFTSDQLEKLHEIS